MSEELNQLNNQYENILREYLQEKSENALYEGQQLSKTMMENGVTPEEIVGYHYKSMQKVLPNLPMEAYKSLKFLLEVMVGYGLQYQEHLYLREKQIQLDSELEVAAGMQQSLIPPTPKNIAGVDLGIISAAAKKMSGDFHHIRSFPDGTIGIAIADIIGKGIPAALCMSMIKFAIESLDEHSKTPNILLRHINRLVEKNVDPHMFITMIYGIYNPQEHTFQYATAGHEPGIYYDAKQRAFSELETKGAVLGLSPDTQYPSFTIQLKPDDMLILLTDGVTETKAVHDPIVQSDLYHLSKEKLYQWFDEVKEYPAQKMVELVHHKLLCLSQFELKDDQTLVVIKRTNEENA